MRRIITTIASITLCFVPTLSLGSECAVLRSARAREAADYLRSEVPAAVPTACVEQAFTRIARLPPEEAVPLLVEFLGWKRPLNAAERLGIFIHPNTPDNLYPAVSALFQIGAPAEPGIIRFLARADEENNLARKHAIYTLLLIHHGNVMDVLENLMRASRSTPNSGDSARLRAAAAHARAQWCDERIEEKCMQLVP
jgi:HEAT repeat protein